MGSRFTACAECVEPVAAEAAEQGLFVLDSLTTADSQLGAAAEAAGAPAVARDVFLDNEPGVDAALAALEAAERTARSQGQAVAIGHPRDATLEALEIWIPQARARGVEIGPVGRLFVQRRGDRLALAHAGL
jgi:polysaccharide deacetylase 2 family uncharacterized protein YibQ